MGQAVDLLPSGCGGSSPSLRTMFATVAQLAEQGILNPLVAGSTPARRTRSGPVTGARDALQATRQGSTPCGSTMLETPWPSGEAPACRAGHGGSTPSGVSNVRPVHDAVNRAMFVNVRRPLLAVRMLGPQPGDVGSNPAGGANMRRDSLNGKAPASNPGEGLRNPCEFKSRSLLHRARKADRAARCRLAKPRSPERVRRFDPCAFRHEVRAAVAPTVEQRFRKPKRAGSTPARRANSSRAVVAQLGERSPYTGRVGGSNPPDRTNVTRGGSSNWTERRAPNPVGGGSSPPRLANCSGVAHRAEQRTDNPPSVVRVHAPLL